MILDSERVGDCFIYQRTITRFGYGRMTYRDKLVHVHRKMYEILVGPIPEGLVPDHVKERCGDKACWNPNHLELVTVRENLLRSENTMAGRNAAKTHCQFGHEFTLENTKTTVIRGGRSTTRSCRACGVLYKRARKMGITLGEYIDRYGPVVIRKKNQYG